MAVVEGQTAVSRAHDDLIIDLKYEFLAPRFYDFLAVETLADVVQAERWFETAPAYEPSPNVARKENLNSFQIASAILHKEGNKEKPLDMYVSPKHLPRKEFIKRKSMSSALLDIESNAQNGAVTTDFKAPVVSLTCTMTVESIVLEDQVLPTSKIEEDESEQLKEQRKVESDTSKENSLDNQDIGVLATLESSGNCYLVPQAENGEERPDRNCSVVMDDNITADMRVQNGHSFNSKKRLHSEAWKTEDHCKTNASVSVAYKSTRQKRNATIRSKQKRSIPVGLTNKDSMPDCQAKKKQKLDGGLHVKIHHMKETILKSEPSCSSGTAGCQNLSHKHACCLKDTTKSLALSPSSPFLSLAERIRRFQTKTPERFRFRPLRQGELPKLKLTRPKEPELVTSYRARPTRVKSTADIEEEMLAKLPKFKARPLNKKMFEALKPATLQKCPLQLPQFQEFHLRTMERATLHQTARDIDSSMSSRKRQRRKSDPGHSPSQIHTPFLHTAMRARPTKVKSSEELEKEELEKIPKFKARPLNKKIFESRGDLGIFRNQKRQATRPMEFHFATDERIHQHVAPPKQFRRLSLDSHPNQQKHAHGLTVPQPFHLLTEDRGMVKEMKFLQEVLEHKLAEKEARIPKANLLPYTTDYPVIPPKPNPKECTRPEPFQLESMLRHEQELQRIAQERVLAQQMEAQMREFHAQPILCDVPVFVPERARKPLTEIQEFSFLVDDRATKRAEFDRKMMEKQNMYKQMKEEMESLRKEEEERQVKCLRKEMIPQARPMPFFDRPFIPQRSSKETTKPVSPRLRVNFRRERRQSLTFSVQKKIHMR